MQVWQSGRSQAALLTFAAYAVVDARRRLRNDGQVQALATIPKTPWFESEEKAKQVVQHFHDAGNPLSRVFTRK